MGEWSGEGRDKKHWSLIRILLLTIDTQAGSGIALHVDVIKWKHFPRYWPCVVTGKFPSQRLVTRSFGVFLICAWINGWVKSRDLRRIRAHYDVIVMQHYNAVVSQITDSTTARSTNCWGWHQTEHQRSTILALCEGNPLVMAGLPRQRANNVKSVPLLPGKIIHLSSKSRHLIHKMAFKILHYIVCAWS